MTKKYTMESMLCMGSQPKGGWSDTHDEAAFLLDFSSWLCLRGHDGSDRVFQKNDDVLSVTALNCTDMCGVGADLNIQRAVRK
jgi:hypothetical protein